MPSKNGMQRTIYKGIPVWMNEAGEMFLYDTSEPFLKIGNNKGLIHNWREILNAHMLGYRAAAEPRARAQKK